MVIVTGVGTEPPIDKAPNKQNAKTMKLSTISTKGPLQKGSNWKFYNEMIYHCLSAHDGDC